MHKINKILSSRKGLTLIELIMTMAILAVLASLVMPLAQTTAKRVKEMELRRNLRTIRTAIDDYKKTYDDLVANNRLPRTVGESGYPESLDILVEGKDFGGIDKTKHKFLRKIPVDPFNPPEPGEKPEWGLRGYTDDPESDSWNGEDVFDVYSLSEETAIDGTKYKDW